MAAGSALVHFDQRQHRDIVLQFLSDISDADLKWLLTALVRANFHIRDHAATLEDFGKIVAKECNLK